MEAEWTRDCHVAGEGSFAEFMQYLGKDMKDVLPTELQPYGTCVATEVPSESSCWGALLRDDASLCKPGFSLGKGHFKNKVRLLHAVAAAAAAAAHLHRRHVNMPRGGVRARHSPEVLSSTLPWCVDPLVSVRPPSSASRASKMASRCRRIVSRR